MTILFYLLLCWGIRRGNSSSKLISLRLIPAGSCYYIYSNLSNDFSLIKIPLDQMQDICWTNNLNHCEDNVTLINTTEFGVLYDYSLIFENNLTLDHFPILSSNDLFQTAAYKESSKGFGLAFRFKNQSQSIVHQLKARGLIDHLSYSFTHFGLKDYLCLGGIHSNATVNKTKGECKIDPLKVGWSCKLSQISIGGLKYNKQLDAYFQVRDPYMRVPLDFMQLLIDTVMKDLMKANNCSYLLPDYRIFCQAAVLSQFDVVSFAIGNYKYSFNLNVLFFQDGVSKIVVNDGSNTTWIIGTEFLDYFSPLFDYENEKVTLYLRNDDDIIIEYLGTHHYLLTLIIICSMLLLFGCLSLSYRKLLH